MAGVRSTQDRSAEKGSSPRWRGQGSDEGDGVRYRPRNQVPKLLEGSGRFADISEVIFIVILITIDDPIRENDEMSTPIKGTVTQSGRIDRCAQVLGITRMRTIVSPPTVYVREADPTCDDQTEKSEDPVHGSDDSHEWVGDRIRRSDRIVSAFPRPVKHKFQKISRASSRPAGQATVDDDSSQWKGATNNRDKAGESLATHQVIERRRRNRAGLAHRTGDAFAGRRARPALLAHRFRGLSR